MSTRTFVMVVALAIAPVAKGEVLVELVPDRPGPYSGGESLTVDVWLHSEVSSDVRLALIQFDFSDTDPALALNPTLTFDYSSIPDDAGYHERHPALLVPWTANFLECICPELFLPLPGGASLHIASIGVQLPTAAGVYRLDALNADEPDDALGARLNLRGPVWRAFTGEITGGVFNFVVAGHPIPTISEWGLGVMASLLLGVGCWTIARRTHGAKPTGPYGDKIRDATHAGCQGASPRVSALTAICSAAVLLGVSTTVVAQPAPIPSKTVAVTIDSGIVSATGVGGAPIAVFSQLVSVDGAPWIRLHFAQVQLVDLSCPDLQDEACYSTPLTLHTAKWADVTPSFGGSSQPNFTDIGYETETFRQLFFTTNVQALLRENIAPAGSENNFTDVGRAVDGFKSIRYPEVGPAKCLDPCE